MATGYTTVTEVPGAGASREQFAMLCTRYAFGAERCGERRVLEVACGAGLGLGYLAGVADRVIGGDCDPDLLRMGRGHYRDRIPLVALDGHFLPFRDGAFGAVILFEALYYLRDVERFLEEARRVLGPGGVLLLCSANREWSGFNRSPFSHSYLSAAELRGALEKKAFAAELYAAFPVMAATSRDRLVGYLRRLAVTMRLIPQTMRGKALLKRIFCGPLQRIPAEITPGMGKGCALVSIPEGAAVAHYKVLYAVGRAA